MQPMSDATRIKTWRITLPHATIAIRTPGPPTAMPSDAEWYRVGPWVSDPVCGSLDDDEHELDSHA
jgi:hypothetical protein